MAEEIISVGASGVDRTTLQEILASHIAYEQARSVRSLAMPRLAIVAAVAAVLLGIAHILSWGAGLLLAAITVGAVAGVAWLEHRAHARLHRALSSVPHKIVSCPPGNAAS